MRRRARSLELTLLAFVGLLLFYLADSTARYLAVYYWAAPYPLGTVARPIVLLGAVILATVFAFQARRRASGTILSPRALGGVAFLSVAVGLLYLDTKVLPLLGIPLPYGTLDASWFLLYALALVVYPAFLAARVYARYGAAVALLPVMLAVGFGANLLSHLYFWLQNVAGVALPYTVVLVGTFAPSVAMPATALLALGLSVRRVPVPLRVRSCLALLAVPLVLLVPAALHTMGAVLPNLILRGWIFWTLGYAGYGWLTPGLFAMAFGVYVLLLLRHRSPDPARRLLFLALLAFPLSGVFVFFLDYSAIPGNLLAITAGALALDVLASRREGP
ncbi:MAG: hypothetical protein ACE5LS_00790 [Thermoplasmata archaeon]